jgi:hypothetical protein
MNGYREQKISQGFALNAKVLIGIRIKNKDKLQERGNAIKGIIKGKGERLWSGLK